MSKSKQFPEPLQVGEEIGEYTLLENMNSCVIAVCQPTHEMTATEIARRLCDCDEACSGMADPVKEIKAMRDNQRVLVDALEKTICALYATNPMLKEHSDKDLKNRLDVIGADKFDPTGRVCAILHGKDALAKLEADND